MSLKYRSALLLIFFCLLYTYTSAQNKYSALQQQIDSLITQDLPKSALEKVHELKALAVADKNDIQRLNAILYKLNLTAQTEKNLEKNIEVLNKETENAAFPLKAILQSVLAETYWNYYKQNRYKIINRTPTKNRENDFRNWDFSTLINEISLLYDASLSSQEILQNTPINEYTEVLTENNQILRPTLFDLLAQRALSFYSNQEYQLQTFNFQNVSESTFMFDTDSLFYNTSVTSPYNDAAFHKSSDIYAELYHFHKQRKNIDALADLLLNRIINLSKQYSGTKNRDSLQLQALNIIEKQYSSSLVIADIRYQKALIYERMQDNVTAYALFQDIINLFPESNTAKNAKVKVFQLRKKELNIRLDNDNIPNKNILATVDFKNIEKAKYALYKADMHDLDEIMPILDRKGENKQEIIEYLKKKKSFRTVDFDLPELHDFKQNTTSIKVDPLPLGIYFLVLEYEGIEPENIKFTHFNVTNMVCLIDIKNGKQKIRVADRATGMPLKHVLVSVYKHSTFTHNIKTREVSSKGKTDANGFFITQKDKYNSYSLRLKNDIWHSSVYTLPDRKTQIQIEGEEDAVSIFTDREIYRPGQTIQFKGIKYINSEKESQVCANNDIEVIFSGNRLTLQKVKLRTNEFGTFSSSFEIPQNALSGSFQIKAGDYTKSIKIEEYKKPTFFIKFSPVKSIAKEPVKITGFVENFAGYPLQETRVSYTIYKNPGFFRGTNEALITDSAKTDKQGKFLIDFIPETTDKIYTYNIVVKVTDIDGETRENQTSVTFGKPSLRFSAVIPNKNFITDTLKTPFSLTDLNGNNITGRIKIRIFKENRKSDYTSYRYPNYPFVPSLTEEEYTRYFPDIDAPYAKKTELLLEKDIVIKDKDQTHINIPGLQNLSCGTYNIELTAYNNLGDSIRLYRMSKLITKKIGTPSSRTDWVFPETEYVNKGENAIFYTGFNKANTILMEVYESDVLKYFKWIETSGNSYEKTEIPYNGEPDLKVVFSTMFNGRFYTSTETIKSAKSNNNLNVQITSFREKVQPGERDKWKLKVTDKDNLPAKAEVLVALYDASLDEISKANSKWSLNYPYANSAYVLSWIPIWSPMSTGSPTNRLTYSYHYIDKTYSKLKYLDYNYSGQLNKIIGNTPQNKAINIRGTTSLVYGEGPVNALNEVTVVGYGEATRSDITGAVAGVTEKGDGSDVFTNVDNTNSFRKNFSETAFFYPHIVTDEKGEAEFQFTFPESLTTWKFRLFAHTKDLRTGYTDKYIISQKPLMISANMPRFFREGDEIDVIAKTVNTSENNISGKSLLSFVNETNKNILDFFNDKESGSRTFKIDAHQSEASKYPIKIPKSIDSLTYRISAYSDFYYDGEEKSVPVLSKMLTLSESKSFILNPGESRKIKIEDFLSSDKRELKSLTFSTQNNPILDIVFALPYLQKENSEYLSSNSLLGNFMTGQMALYVRKNYRYATIFPDSSLSKLKNLKNSPWFNPSQVLEQQKTLIHLFKGTNAYTEQAMALNKLEKMQKSNGSFPWFESCIYEDRYITQNIVASLGKSSAISTSSFFDKQKGRIAKKALSYVDNELIKNINSLTSLDIQGWYARSFYKDSSALIGFDSCQTKYLDYAHKNWQKFTDYEKGLIAYTFINLDRNDLAQPILKSLKEKAIFSDVIGAYWPREQSFFLWNRAEIEKHSLMIELFGKQESEANFVLQLKKWLLLNKQANNWQTSNATMSACFALLSNGSYEPEKNTIRYSTKRKLEPELQIMNAGKFTYTVPLVNDKPDFPIYEIYNPGKNFMIASFSQTFNQNLKDVKSHNNGLIITKKYFKKDRNGNLKEINNNNELHVGDKITVRLYLVADRALEYIKLRDERPSGTEPTSVISKYYYLENLFYYLTPKDTSTDIFINHLPKGQYIIDYDLYCAQSGKFSSGISKAESLYAPEFGAYTSSQNIIIK